jgi:ribosomal protein S18 acetylase RimI-like enzyme
MSTRADAVEGTAEDITRLSGVLQRAFETDPFHRWVLRSDRAWRHGSDRLFASVLAMAVSNGRLLTTPDLAGAAIWSPPGYEPPAIAALRAFILLGLYSGTRLPTLLKGFKLQEQHKPDAPHWYLYAIGTDPEHQGRGVGTALIRPLLELCDKEGLAAHLDTNTESNVQFYERRGFQVSGEFDLPDGPHSWAMTRPAQ